MTRAASLLATVVFVSLVAPPAGGAEPAPKWSRIPTAEDVDAVFPAAAKAEEVGGRATLRCAPTAEGALSGCEVSAEQPTGLGFGAAALALAAKFQLAVQPGQAAPRSVTVPIRFSGPFREALYIDGSGPGPFMPVNSRGQPGQALIECVVSKTGGLETCQLLAESPKGRDLGAAALIMAKRGKIATIARKVDGKPVAGDVARLVVRYPSGRRRCGETICPP